MLNTLEKNVDDPTTNNINIFMLSENPNSSLPSPKNFIQNVKPPVIDLNEAIIDKNQINESKFQDIQKDEQKSKKP